MRILCRGDRSIAALPLPLPLRSPPQVFSPIRPITAVIAGLSFPREPGADRGTYRGVHRHCLRHRSEHGVGGLTIATLWQGFLIIAFGFAWATQLKFIPIRSSSVSPVALPLIIFSSQVKDFFGLGIDNTPAGFYWEMDGLFSAFHPGQLVRIRHSAGNSSIQPAVPPCYQKIPGSIVAIVLQHDHRHRFSNTGRDDRDQIWQYPEPDPCPVSPRLILKQLRPFIQPAFAIALLGARTLLYRGSRWNDDRRAPSFQYGIGRSGHGPIFRTFSRHSATGAIARITTTNIKNGGRTPIAGITHALVLLPIMMLFAPLAKLIPLTTLPNIGS